MKNFYFKLDVDEPIIVKTGTRHFINYDIPDVYYIKDGEETLVTDSRYGNLTVYYNELPLEDRKNVFNFIKKSAEMFYKWSYTWPSRQNQENNLAEDVKKFVERIYKETFGELYKEELKKVSTF